jgi:hypothetical protein
MRTGITHILFLPAKMGDWPLFRLKRVYACRKLSIKVIIAIVFSVRLKQSLEQEGRQRGGRGNEMMSRTERRDQRVRRREGSEETRLQQNDHPAQLVIKSCLLPGKLLRQK